MQQVYSILTKLLLIQNNNGGSNAAVRKIDTLLAKQGLPRSERRELLKQIKGTHDAAPITHDADLVLNIQSLIQTLRGN